MERRGRYHVTLKDGRTEDCGYPDVGVKEGALIFYDNEGVALIYAAGMWEVVVFSPE